MSKVSMDLKSIVAALNDRLDANKKFVAGVLTTESAISAISNDGKFMQLNEENSSYVNDTLKAAKDFEEKLTLESASTFIGEDGNQYKDISTGDFIKSYVRRLTDVRENFGNSVESFVGDLTHESGQGSEIMQQAKTAILVNLGRTNQDAFSEEFFPSILSPDTNQITFRYVIGAYIKEWKKDDKTLLPIHETLVDTSYLQGDTLRLIPAFNIASEYLNTNVKFVELNGAKSIETAPYLFGKEVDVLAACVDEVSVAGVKNNVRTIAPNIKLGKIFFSNATKDDEYGVDTEVKFNFDISALNGAVATPSYSGRKESFQFSFGVGAVYNVKLSSFAKGNGEELFPGYPNHTVVFELKIAGNGQLTFGTLENSVTKFNIVRVMDGDKNILSGTALETIMNKIKDVKPVGYSIKAYEANGDVVNEGNVLTLDNDQEVYAIGYKQPLTVKGPVANLYSKSTDYSELAQFITSCGDKCSCDAKTLLFSTFAALENAIDPKSVIGGLGNKLITPTAVKSVLDLTKIANMETSALNDSVVAKIRNTIKTVVTKMYVQSQYKAVFNRFYTGRKMRVSIGIDQRLEAWLPTGMNEITREIDGYVVSTPDSRINDKIMLAFTSSSPDRNKEIDILGLGFNAYDTTVVTEVRKMIGGSVINAVMAFPKYEHIIMCTVMGRINVTGLDAVFIG